METKEPDSRLSVRKEDLDDQELYRLNQVINDLYSKITTARDETTDAAKKFVRSGVIASGSDQSTASIPPPIDGGIPQPQATDWTLNSVVYSAGEDGLQYGFTSASINNKPAGVDYYSMFIQDYSSGYVNTSGTTVTLTAASKEAGNTFERCVAGQTININSVAYILAADAVAPFESVTITSSAGTQSNVYFNLNPVDGKWEEIASDAEAGTWQPRPTTGWDVPCCLTASTKDQKTYEPPAGVNYKRLQFAAWGDAPQVTNFSVSLEEQDPSVTDIPSGKFVVNFTKPLDPEYYYASIERLWYVNAPNPTPPYWTGTQAIGATARVDVSGSTITYNGSSNSSTFTGQYFNYVQPGDTVYVGGVSTLTDANSYIVSEVVSNTQLKLTTSPPSGTNVLFAQWGRMAGEINPFTQVDYWPLPTSAEYWKFRARSVNHREIANNSTPPETAVTVPASGGLNPTITPPMQLASGDWSLNALQTSIDEAGNSSIFVSATITNPSATADYYSLFWQRVSTPVSGDWIEIAADATAGTWQEWPSVGATYVVAIAANKYSYKLAQPDETIASYYKTLTIPAWGDADQVTGFSVAVETDNRAGVPSGRFVFNFTKPADPDYYYAQISRIATDSSYVPLPGAVYGIVAGEVNPTKQTDWWPLPETAEYWTFKVESVNYRKVVNATAAPTSNVSVSTSSGITQIAPATITTAAFASTIRPVDLVTTAGIGVTSIVVSSNTGTVTTASAHGLASGRQVAIYGGTGTSAKLNGLYSINVTGGSTFTITTSGVSNGTYSAGLNEVPLPALPSATYPSGATAFVTVSARLYRVTTLNTWTSAADGSDIVSNSITAGQIAAGAISTTELFAGEILVGGSSGTPDKPTKFSVRDSGGTEIGFIGDVSSPISFTGGYFKNLLIAPTLSTTATPRIYATSAGSMELVGVNLTVENTGGSTAYPGRVKISTANSSISPIIVENTSGTSSASYMGPYNVGVRSNALNNFYPFVELYRTGTYASIQSYGDPLLNSYVDIRTDATASNSYANFKSVPIQVNGITAIDYFNSAPRGQFGDLSCTTFRLGTTATAGYVLTTDASGIGTWQAAGAASAAGSTGQVQYNNSGVLAATANFSWNNTSQLLQVASSSTDPNRGIISSQHNNDVQAAGLYLRKSRGTLSSPSVVLSGDFIGALTSQAYDGSNYISSSRIAFQVESTPSTGSVPTCMIFQTGASGGGSERIRITSGGSVLIGTSTVPDSFFNLTVYGSTNGGLILQSSTNYSGIAQFNNDVYFDIGRGGASGNAIFRRSNANTESMRIDSSGRLGIGTSPDALLTVNTIASFGDGAETTPSIAHKGDLNTGFWFPAVDTVAVSTDGAERWRVTSAGFLIPADSDTYDIGVLSTNRVRGVYTKIVDTAASGGTGDYIQTRKIQLFDNTGSTAAPSFWDMNVVMSGVGALQNSYFYMRDNGGNKVFQSERISSGSAVDRTFWYTDLLPDTNFGQSLGSTSYKWQTIYTNQLGDSLNTVVVYGGNSTFSQVITGSFQFTASPVSGYFLKSDVTGYASWATVTSQLSAGTGISISGTTTATITNSGVTSITGTSNQVIASASTGGVTLSLPQSIATTSNVTFNSLTLANGASNGILIKDTGGTARNCLTIASDNNLYLDNNDSTYDIYIRPGSGRYTFVDGSYFAPSNDNTISLGYNGKGWSNVYSYAYYANDGSWKAGATGTFTTADSKTVTVRDGIIISIV